MRRNRISIWAAMAAVALIAVALLAVGSARSHGAIPGVLSDSEMSAIVGACGCHTEAYGDCGGGTSDSCIECNASCGNTWTIAGTRAEKCVFQAPANNFVCEPLKDASGNPIMIICKTTYTCTAQGAQAGVTCSVQKWCVSGKASQSCAKCIAVATQVTQPTYYCKSP